MTHEFDFQAELSALRELYSEIDVLMARPPEELRRVVPAVSAWSAEKQLAHLALANELVARNLRSLLKGSGLFVVESGEPPQAALDVLIEGRFPRGRAAAPRIVRPPEDVQREYLVEWLAGNRSEFEAFSALLPELRAVTKKVPHQILGALSASQWLRFAAIHTRHHLEIARETLAS